MAGAAWPDNWVKDPNAKLLFMGDSITASWDANAFKKFCVNRSYVNLGRNMEQVAHLLWRLDHVNCDGAQAKLIVLMIGSNDGACNFSSQDVAAGVGAVVAKLRTKLPQAKVLVMSILPRGERPKDKQLAFTQINPLIAKLADGKNVFHLDICAAEQNRKFVAEMDRWSAMTEKSHLWDYVTSFRDYLGPFPNVLALQGNLRFFRGHHVVGIFEEGAYQGGQGHMDFGKPGDPQEHPRTVGALEPAVARSHRVIAET